MKNIHVTYNNKELPAYRYAPSVIMVLSYLLPDSDRTVIEDVNGYRYKRKITGNTGEALYRFDKI